MKKLILDTLAPKGTFEHKRIASFTAYWSATIFGFMYPNSEFFYGWLAYSATAIGLNVWNKKIEK